VCRGSVLKNKSLFERKLNSESGKISKIHFVPSCNVCILAEQNLQANPSLMSLPLFRRLGSRKEIWLFLTTSTLVQGILEDGLDLSFYLMDNPIQSWFQKSVLKLRQVKDPVFKTCLSNLVLNQCQSWGGLTFLYFMFFLCLKTMVNFVKHWTLNL